MNPRIIVPAIGALTALLGAFGVLYPDRVMGMLGFTAAEAAHLPATLGEVRATYGGIFVVVGVYTIVCGLDPASNRSWILFFALLWLGAAGGRLFGVFVDGNPGLFGWASLVFETVIGGALLVCSQGAAASDRDAGVSSAA
jgi:hypothetical protein